MIPDNEIERLKKLDLYEILDTVPELEYDDLAFLAAQICTMPIATIAFLDADRKWHKAKYGIDKDFVARDAAICSYTILGSESLVVNDTLKHDVFRGMGMVTNPPHVRFYAGIPLLSPEGFALGTLCVVDTRPRRLSKSQLDALKILARSVEIMLETRLNIIQMKIQHDDIERLNQALETLSRTDDLTGLWNRRVMDEVLERELQLYKRHATSFALLILDIDKFKALNDIYGHLMGDKSIQFVAKVLEGETRETDCCIRYGGDEFVVILPNIDREYTQFVVDRIRSEIEKSVESIKPFTVSIGAVVVESQCVDSDSLLKRADKCLYRAKDQGSNLFEIEAI